MSRALRDEGARRGLRSPAHLTASFNLGLGVFPAPGDRYPSCRAEDLPAERLAMGSHTAEALRQSSRDLIPAGGTPTRYALLQVLARALLGIRGDPLAAQRGKAVVLITDGQPTSGDQTCDDDRDLRETIKAVATLAGAGLSVYVVGIAGTNEAAMEQLAVAAAAGQPVQLAARVACLSRCRVDRELCNNLLDDDCDGQIDEGCAGGGTPACTCTATETCQGGCPPTCLVEPERCDERDNNCNGVVDEGCAGPIIVY